MRFFHDGWDVYRRARFFDRAIPVAAKTVAERTALRGVFRPPSQEYVFFFHENRHQAAQPVAPQLKAYYALLERLVGPWDGVSKKTAFFVELNDNALSVTPGYYHSPESKGRWLSANLARLALSSYLDTSTPIRPHPSICWHFPDSLCSPPLTTPPFFYTLTEFLYSNLASASSLNRLIFPMFLRYRLTSPSQRWVD